MLVTDDGIARLANELHPEKTEFPMLVTDDGTARLANEVHPEKALSPMLVTDDGIARLTNELHPSKALNPILVTDDVIAVRGDSRWLGTVGLNSDNTKTLLKKQANLYYLLEPNRIQYISLYIYIYIFHVQPCILYCICHLFAMVVGV